MFKKLIKTILGISACATTLSFLPAVSCKNDTPTTQNGPSIDEAEKTQVFSHGKIVFNFIWNGWRPKDNKFDDIKIKITSEQGEVTLGVTNFSAIAPNKSFSIEVSITNPLLPVYSENITFNIEFDCTIKSKKQKFVVENFLGMYIPDKIIIEPDNKTYDMVSDMNTQESYTTTDEFILADTDITPTDLRIQIGQVTGEALGNILVDVHATGQKFYLRLSTTEFNPHGDKYQLSLQIFYKDIKLFDSTSYYLIFKPEIIEQQKTMRCFPVDGTTNTWTTTENMYLLHAPADEIPDNYNVVLNNQPGDWNVNTKLFRKSGSFKTEYSLYIEFEIPPITEYTSWDIEVTITYQFLGETYVILDKSIYKFYTAPAIDNTTMHVEHQEVTEGTPHSEAVVTGLNWTDRFGLSYDIFDTPEITLTHSGWPEDIIQPIEAVIIPSETDIFGVTVSFYRSSNLPLDKKTYQFEIKFKMKNINNGQQVTDVVECVLEVK